VTALAHCNDVNPVMTGQRDTSVKRITGLVETHQIHDDTTRCAA
jgi:hypothetical protein